MSTTFPVWVGSLSPSVQETDLLEFFGRYGTVVSVKVMRDNKGRSRKFGFVNYHTLKEAEEATKFGRTAVIRGNQVTVKGPRDLQKEGHFKMPSHTKSPVDYRPLTDCLFFMEKGGCSNGDNCPYRHNKEAKSSEGVCNQWIKKKCTNKRCPLRHPGGKMGVAKPQREHEGKTQKVSKRTRRRKADSTVEMARSTTPDQFEIFTEGLSQSSSITYDDDSSELSGSESAGSESFSGFEGDEELSLYSSQYSSEISGPVKITGNSDDESDDIATSRSNSSSLSGSFSRMQFKEHSGSLGNSGDVSSRKNVPLRRKKNSGLGDSWGKKHNEASGSNSSSPGSQDAAEQVLSKHYKPVKEDSTDKSPDADQLEDKDVRSLLLPAAGMEPVGVFWDIENCSIPKDKSAFSVAQKIRKVFFDSKREAEFVCVCDTLKENSDIIDDLNNAQVTVVHVSAVAKNAADDKLRAAMRKFAHYFLPPATVVLISGDINFASELSDMRDRHNFNIILVHNAWCKEEFKAFAHKTYLWEEFIQDVEERKSKTSYLPTEVVVKNLPTNISRFKIRERLGMLSGNCGGKVTQVHTTSAVVRFATPELTIRAQKRMNGQDVFGHAILVEMTSQRNVQGPPLMQGHFQGPRPPHGNVHRPPPLPNYFIGAPPFPVHHHRPPLPPPTMEPLMISDVVPYLDNPLNVVLKFLPLGTGRVVVHPINPPGLVDDVQVLKRIKGELTQMAVYAQPPVIIHPDIILLWENIAQLCAVVTIDVQKTAETRRDWTLVQGSNLAPGVARLTVDMRSAASKKKWDVTPITSYEGDLEDRITRSHVIHVMKQYKHGWVKVNDFRSHYTSAFDLPCQEVDIQSAAGNIVEFLGPIKERVIIFSQYSPLVRLTKKPSLVKRIVRLVETHGRVDLLSLVSIYERTYGPLPYKKDGVELSEVLATLPLKWNIDKKDIAKTYLSPQTTPVESGTASAHDQLPQEVSLKRNTFFQECALLLAENGGAVQVKNIQPFYQTRYKKSPRLSDYGSDNMRELLKLSPLFKLSDDQEVVMLTSIEGGPVNQNGAEGGHHVLSKKEFFQYSCALLRDYGGQISTSKFQQHFQTKLHISPKVSNYGASSMVELLQQCPSIQVKGNHYHLVDVPQHPVHNDRSVLKRNIIGMVAGQPTRRLNMNDLNTLYESAHKESLYSHLPPGHSMESFISILCSPELEITGHLESAVLQFSEKWLAQRIQSFKDITVDIISKKPEGFVLFDKLAEEFLKQTGKQLVVMEYGFKKLSSAVERIAGSVDVGEMEVPGVAKPVAVLRLVKQASVGPAEETGASKKDRPSSRKTVVVMDEHPSLGSVKRDLEFLVYCQPHHILELVHVRPCFEKMFRSTLDYKEAGHSKLLSFLKFHESSFVLNGEGPSRDVVLNKDALLAMNLFTILRDFPAGLEMSQIVPLYSKRFGSFVVKEFGHKKLINLLKEELGDLIEIFGLSPVRRVYLKDSSLCSGFGVDEVVAERLKELQFEFAFLLYHAPGYTLTCTGLEEQYLTCFGKKMAVICEHRSCDVDKLISEHTPLMLKWEEGSSLMVEIPPSHVFACEMAEIVSQHGESDLAMTTFTAVFEKQFGRTPKPQNYGCATFDQVLNSSKAYMEDQLYMKDGAAYVKKSVLSSIFSLLGKIWKDELKKVSSELSSTAEDMSECDGVGKETEWPSFLSEPEDNKDQEKPQDKRNLPLPISPAPAVENVDTLKEYKAVFTKPPEQGELDKLEGKKQNDNTVQPPSQTRGLSPEIKQPPTADVYNSSSCLDGANVTSKYEPSPTGAQGGRSKRKKNSAKLAINFTSTMPTSGVSALSTGVHRARSDMSGIGSGVSGIGSGVSGIGSGVSGISSGVSGIGSGVSGIGSGVSGIGSGVSGIGSGVSGIGSGVSGIGSGVSGIGSGVSGIGSGVSGIGSGVSGIGSGVSGIGSGVRGIGSGVSGIGSGVSGIGSGVSGTLPSVGALGSGKLPSDTTPSVSHQPTSAAVSNTLPPMPPLQDYGSD